MTIFIRHWWSLALRGALAALFGGVALLSPAWFLGAFTLIFGIYAMIDGVFSLASAYYARKRQALVLVLQGLLSIGIGLLALTIPGLAIVYVVFLVASWFLITGILELSAAFRYKQSLGRSWLMLVIVGLLSLVCSLVLYIYPIKAAITIATFAGGFSIAWGLLMLIFSMNLRWGKSSKERRLLP